VPVPGWWFAEGYDRWMRRQLAIAIAVLGLAGLILLGANRGSRAAPGRAAAEYRHFFTLGRRECRVALRLKPSPIGDLDAWTASAVAARVVRATPSIPAGDRAALRAGCAAA
jgi:hypothetical protein